MDTRVRLCLLDDALLAELADVAAADADPEEVMPPIDAPPPWDDVHRAAFLAFHLARREHAAEVTFAICVGGRVAGAIRLAPAAEPGVWETGLWVGRSHRGQGVGAAACALVETEAQERGASALVAETTQGNRAARALLARSDARTTTGDGDGGAVAAWIDLDRP